jgi:carbon-monoxide dehydrogenase medium subunit
VKAPAFAYAKPQSLIEVFDLLERYGDEAKVLAGGQSLIPSLNMRLAAPKVLIDIQGLPELSGIQVSEDTVTIGATTRHLTLETSPEIARHLPLIAQALPHIAHAAVRNRGTFGGSIAFADPAAELPACSLALGAEFVIGSNSGRRRVAARDFFKGLYETDLRPGELLLAGEIAAIRPGYRSAFQELARRHGDYALIGLAAHARYEGRVYSDAALVFFGVGGAPVPAESAAGAMEGRPFSQETVIAAQRALERDLPAHSDLHASASARLHLARILLGRVLRELAQE